MIISSRDNPKIKRTVLLASSSNERRKTGLFVIDGLRLCRDAALNGYSVRELFYTERFCSEHKEDCDILLSSAQSAFCVSDDVMKKLSDTVSPQGCICVCDIPAVNELSLRKKGRYVVLEDISDPGNLGTVCRTAEAFSVDAVIISGGCDPFSQKALRASMGALLRLPVIRCEAQKAILHMNDLSIKTYAAVVSDFDGTIDKCDMSPGCAVVIGNEANGLKNETARLCYKRITIPMSGKAESLNAAAAATILIWEMMK